MSNNLLEESSKEILITKEDVAAALDFWKHYKIPISEGLDAAVKAFEADPSFENQEKIKYYVCSAISTTDHPAFKDPMFTQILELTNEITFEMQFEKDLEESLVSKE